MKAGRRGNSGPELTASAGVDFLQHQPNCTTADCTLKRSGGIVRTESEVCANSQGARSARARPLPSPSPSLKHFSPVSPRGGTAAVGKGQGEVTAGRNLTARRTEAAGFVSKELPSVAKPASGGVRGLRGPGAARVTSPSLAATGGFTVKGSSPCKPTGTRRKSDAVGHGTPRVGCGIGRQDISRCPQRSSWASGLPSSSRPVGGTGAGGATQHRRVKEPDREGCVEAGVHVRTWAVPSAAGSLASPANGHIDQQQEIEGRERLTTVERVCQEGEGIRISDPCRLNLDRDVDTECSVVQVGGGEEDVGEIATTSQAFSDPPPAVGATGSRALRRQRRGGSKVEAVLGRECEGSENLTLQSKLKGIEPSSLGSSVGSNDEPEAAQIVPLVLVEGKAPQQLGNRGEPVRDALATQEVPSGCRHEVPFLSTKRVAGSGPLINVQETQLASGSVGWEAPVTLTPGIQGATLVDDGFRRSSGSVDNCNGTLKARKPKAADETTTRPKRLPTGQLSRLDGCHEIGSQSSSAQGCISLGSAATDRFSTHSRGRGSGAVLPHAEQEHDLGTIDIELKPQFEKELLSAASDGNPQSHLTQGLVRLGCHEQQPVHCLDFSVDTGLLQRSSFAEWGDQAPILPVDSVASNGSALAQAKVQSCIHSHVQVEILPHPPVGSEGPASLEKATTYGVPDKSMSYAVDLERRSGAGISIGGLGLGERLTASGAAVSSPTAHIPVFPGGGNRSSERPHCSHVSGALQCADRRFQVGKAEEKEGRVGKGEIDGLSHKGRVALPRDHALLSVTANSLGYRMGDNNTRQSYSMPLPVTSQNEVGKKQEWRPEERVYGLDSEAEGVCEPEEGSGALHAPSGVRVEVKLQSKITQRPSPSNLSGKWLASTNDDIAPHETSTTTTPVRRRVLGTVQHPLTAVKRLGKTAGDSVGELDQGQVAASGGSLRASRIPESMHPPWMQSSMPETRHDMSQEIDDVPDDSQTGRGSLGPAGGEGNRLQKQSSSLSRPLGGKPAGVVETGMEPYPGLQGMPGCLCGQLFKGVCRDVRLRIPQYFKDWRDDHPVNTVKTIIYLLLISIVPALALGMYLELRTEGKTGVIEVISSISLSGLLFSIVGGQPLLRLGVSAPFCCFLAFVYSSSVRLHVEFLPWMGWIGIWATSFVIMAAATDGCCRLSHGVTRFTWDALQVFSSLCLIWDGVASMIKTFHKLPLGSAAVGLWLAGSVTVATIFIGAADRWPLFKQAFRARLAAASPLIVVIFFTGLSYAPRLSKIGLPNVGVPQRVGFLDGERKLGSFVKISSVPVGKIVMASVPGFFLALLIFVDHTVAAAAVQNPSFNLQKPTVYHWDLLLVGGIMLLCSVLGLPFSYGLFYQSIEHVSALSITVAAGNDEEAAQGCQQILFTHEQRLSGFFTSILFAGVLLPNVSMPIGKIPQAVLLEVRTKLVDEAYVEQHNFGTFSKKALDIEVKLGSAHQASHDGRKRLPQDWKKKGQLMFVDHDGQRTEIDDFPDLGEVTEQDGASETSDGGVVAPIKEKARGTGKKKVVRSTGQGDQGTPAWVKLGLEYEVWRDRVARGTCMNCGNYGHTSRTCRGKKVLTRVASPTVVGLSSNSGGASASTSQGNTSGQ
ncbi:hypothetical protein CBR_g66734 [Chara braunii]|uniref:CCHC-type domain-containing protein n=1 Tax=Chara braunii TaxID=69332 RepID=A0A388JQ83_CHABU|nr:hypothetical protein CBR_g66734 [Chara braunii]|eukprot:GBG59928.1 hypothetical protein CBR_g66734 [Chara braunii]